MVPIDGCRHRPVSPGKDQVSTGWYLVPPGWRPGRLATGQGKAEFAGATLGCRQDITSKGEVPWTLDLGREPPQERSLWSWVLGTSVASGGDWATEGGGRESTVLARLSHPLAMPGPTGVPAPKHLRLPDTQDLARVFCGRGLWDPGSCPKSRGWLRARPGWSPAHPGRQRRERKPGRPACAPDSGRGGAGRGGD